MLVYSRICCLFLIVKLLLTQIHSKLMQFLFLKFSITLIGKRLLWPSAHSDRYSLDSIVWQKDFVMLEVPPSCQETNPRFSQFFENTSENKFSLTPTMQQKAFIHPGVKSMLGTVMAISFLGHTCFSKICNIVLNCLESMICIKEMAMEVKSTEERCSDIGTLA